MRYIEIFEEESDDEGKVTQWLQDRIYEGEDGKLHYQEGYEDDEELANYKLEDIPLHFNNGYIFTSCIIEGDLPEVEG